MKRRRPQPGVTHHSDGTVELRVLVPGWMFDALTFAGMVSGRSFADVLWYALKRGAIDTIQRAELD